MPGRSGQLGFSLIELLVVITIAAVLATLVVLSTGGWSSENSPERQLQRFAAQLDQQCEHALLQSRARGMSVSDNGFQAWHLSSQGWQALTGTARQWPAGVQPRLMVDGFPVNLAAPAATPQIVCEPLGELTSFELDFPGTSPSLRLLGHAHGRLEVLSP
ncbi:MAG: prepilin-type N-terminal cleavage/methylation domain-containing protein [Wenzhouxiangella sp.]